MSPAADSMGVDVGINGGFGYSEMLRCRGMYEERGSVRCSHSPPQLIRGGDQMHAFLELSEKIAQGFLVSDNVYKNVQWTDTGDTLGCSFMDLTGGRIDRENTTHRISSENSLWHQRPSLHRDASVHYHDMRMVSLDNSFRKESSRDNEFAVLAEKYDLPRDPTHRLQRKI